MKRRLLWEIRIDKIRIRNFNKIWIRVQFIKILVFGNFHQDHMFVSNRLFGFKLKYKIELLK